MFTRAVAQPASERRLTVAGCRILARQFRARVEARQARAAALVGHSQACPFDLHTLLPVPAVILQLGPTHPAAMTWLAAHWGITDRLRQVVERPAGHRPAIGKRSYRRWLWLLHRRRDAACGHRRAGARWPALHVALRSLSAD